MNQAHPLGSLTLSLPFFPHTHRRTRSWGSNHAFPSSKQRSQEVRCVPAQRACLSLSFVSDRYVRILDPKSKSCIVSFHSAAIHATSDLKLLFLLVEKAIVSRRQANGEHIATLLLQGWLLYIVIDRHTARSMEGESWQQVLTSFKKRMKEKYGGSAFFVVQEPDPIPQSPIGVRENRSGISGNEEQFQKLLNNRFVIVKTLSESASSIRCSYAKIHLAFDLHTNDFAAIKSVKSSALTDPDMKLLVENEISILQRVNHKNLVKLVSKPFVGNDGTIHLPMEYCSQGSLGDKFELYEHMNIQEETAKMYCKQLISAMQYLHEEIGVSHRDIHLDNICLDSQGNIKLVDFGLAERVSIVPLYQQVCGNFKYCSPEMLKQEKYRGPEVDIWSLGVVLFKLLTGYFPFAHGMNTIQGKMSIDLEDEELTPECKRTLQTIFTLDPSMRPCVKDIANSEWLRK